MAVRGYPAHVKGCATRGCTWGQQQIPGSNPRRAEKKKLKGECNFKKSSRGSAIRKSSRGESVAREKGLKGSREGGLQRGGVWGIVWVQKRRRQC
jgi:hypothetical protein